MRETSKGGSSEPPPSARDVPRKAEPESARVTTPPSLPRGPLTLMAMGALTCVIMLGVSIRQRVHAAASALPVLAEVPAFERPDQRGRTVSAASLRGSVWIADFFFTACPTMCPKLTARMETLQNKLKALGARRGEPMPVRLVSFSVDPDNDTKDKLFDYARRFHADDDTWSFLGGSSADVDRVVVQGFKIDVERGTDDTGVFTIMHGDWFVLADARGRIRGFYDSNDAERLDALVADVARLVDEARDAR